MQQLHILQMQQLHILHRTFDFKTAQIVLNCTLKYALSQVDNNRKDTTITNYAVFFKSLFELVMTELHFVHNLYNPLHPVHTARLLKLNSVNRNIPKKDN